MVLVLSSVVSGELQNKTFTLPKCSKKDFATLILAKLLIYGSYIMFVTTMCALVDYAYTGMLFGVDLPDIAPVIRGGIFQGLYYTYVLGFIMLAGSLFAKPISAGLIALIPAYGTYIIPQLFNVVNYTPSGLLTEASLLAYTTSSTVTQPIIITILLIVVLVLLTIIRLEKMELTKR